MTFALLSLLGLAAGFGGLAWGYFADRKERELRRCQDFLLIGPNVEIGSYGTLSGTMDGPRRFKVIGHVGPMTAVQFLDPDPR